MQYGHRLMVRSCHRLLTGFQAKAGALGELRTSIFDAGQRGSGAGAVAATCDKLDSLSRKHRSAYVSSVLSHVAQVCACDGLRASARLRSAIHVLRKRKHDAHAREALPDARKRLATVIRPRRRLLNMTCPENC